MKDIRVSITNYCNRNCEYCFSKGKVSSEKDEMSIEDFEYVLDFCEKDGIKKIVVFGGEPTSHTRFKDIIGMLQGRGFYYLLLTNGLFDADILNLLKKKKYPVLVNYNHPDTFKNAGEWETVNKNLERMSGLGMDITLGYNIYEKNPDYRFFLDGIKKFNIKKIRWDLARPSMNFTNKHFGISEYFDMVPVITKFIRECMESGSFFSYDCPFPMCMLLKKDFNFLHPSFHLTWIHSSCSGDEITIDPGLKIAACPAAGMDFGDITLKDFDSLYQVDAFIKKTLYGLKWNNYPFPYCGDCIYGILKECQGGCLGHKRDDKRAKLISKNELRSFLDGYKKSAGNPVALPDINQAVSRSIAAAEKKLNEEGKDSFLCYSLGRSYETLGDYEKAVKLYGDVIEIDRTHSLAKDRLNLVYQLKALKSNPDNRHSWSRLEEVLKKIYLVDEIVKDELKYYKSKFRNLGGQPGA